jgi:Protein of unknown function (DUF3347)
MKKVILLLFLAIAAFVAYWFLLRKKEDKPEPPPMAHIELKKHSEKFNLGLDSIVNAYLDIKNAFVEADTVLAKTAAKNFIALLDRLPIDELKKDTTSIYETAKGNLVDVKSNAESLLMQTDITEMRKDFSMVTEMMYPSFLTTVKYEGKKLYVAKCPMAFNETTAANWISNSAEIVNPYMGKNHPKYHAGMLGCGDVVDSIYAK